MTPTAWSISGLAIELDIDRRKAAALVRDLEPVEREGRVAMYRMADAVAALVGRRGGGDAPDSDPDKRRLLRARADIAEMEADRMAGALIAADDVTKTWVAIVANCRARLLAIPTKAASLVAVEATPEKCFEVLTDLVHEPTRR
jgi:hypothetical protein